MHVVLEENLGRKMLLLGVLCAAVLGATAQSPILISEFVWCIHRIRIDVFLTLTILLWKRSACMHELFAN